MPTGVYKRTDKVKNILRKKCILWSKEKKGKHLSEETKRKIGLANKGENNYFYGKHPSEETKKKISEKLAGKKHPNWKGGRRIDRDGYVEIWLDPNDFFASMITKNNGNRLPEHRLIMARYLGRCLESWEIVHHINRIRTDNRIENLEIIDDKKHLNFHDENRLLKNEIKKLRILLRR